MARQREYERLAKLKVQKKEIEEEIKALQDQILLHSPKEEVETTVGPLKLRAREEYEVADNHKLIKNSAITQQIFINSAKLAPSKVKTIIGETEFTKLVRKKVIKWKGTTKYYQLTEAPKKNQESIETETPKKKRRAATHE